MPDGEGEQPPVKRPRAVKSTVTRVSPPCFRSRVMPPEELATLVGIYN